MKKKLIVRRPSSQSYVSQTISAINTIAERPKKEKQYFQDNFGGLF